MLIVAESVSAPVALFFEPGRNVVVILVVDRVDYRAGNVAAVRGGIGRALRARLDGRFRAGGRKSRFRPCLAAFAALLRQIIRNDD